MQISGLQVLESVHLILIILRVSLLDFKHSQLINYKILFLFFTFIFTETRDTGFIDLKCHFLMACVLLSDSPYFLHFFIRNVVCHC